MQQYLQHKVFQILKQIAGEEDLQVYAIGGFVRDIFLEKESKDIDIVVQGNGIALANKTAERLHPSPKVTVFKRFGTAMFKYNGTEFEFVGARKESYTPNSRKPAVESGSLQDDQNRRDLTINALAISLHPRDFGTLTDPFNGLQDLQNKIIRTPLNPDITFSDDPLRMMRAVRFSCKLNFEIHPETLAAIARNKDRIKIISAERISDELNKIILSDYPVKGFNILDQTGILSIIFPEFTALKGVETIRGLSHKDNFLHSLQVLENIAQHTDNLWLRWAAILHDIAKPATKRFTPRGWTFHSHEFVGMKMVPRIFRRLKLPMNEKMAYVQKLVLLHLRPIALVESKVTDSALRRLLFDAGDEIEDLLLLSRADITSKNERRVKQYLRNLELVEEKLKQVEEKDKIRNWQPPVSGDEIMETFCIQPCKTVGIIKDAIREAILDGFIPNTHQDAYQFMLEKGKELGLSPKY
ncbi:MAG: tRNA nucleotidyltransferase [Bacteroidia bacterium]|nr:MAG: tRNA nucleotidyltransferase [Bacteroidia bacterium]